MGEVYKARDTRLDRTVALKVLPSHIARREDVLQRFEREARAVSSLKHPHICVLHDVGREGDVDYMVMEHLEGESLFSRLQKGPLPFAQALEYARQIADALDRAHRQGVVHRDLKPGNVMLTRDGAKVLDFGLAKTAPKATADAATLTMAITSEGTILGTPQYMAPEQIEGREADARTTSSPSAACCTKWSPASVPSTAKRKPASSARSSPPSSVPSRRIPLNGAC